MEHLLFYMAIIECFLHILKQFTTSLYTLNNMQFSVDQPHTWSAEHLNATCATFQISKIVECLLLRVVCTLLCSIFDKKMQFSKMSFIAHKHVWVKVPEAI